MRNLVITLLFLLSVSFSGTAKIRESLTSARQTRGWQAIQLDVQGQQVLPSSTITWYGDNIGGMSRIDFYGPVVSSGNATTINCIPVMADGTELDSEAQTLTSGTDLTVIKSNYYKYSYRLHNVFS